MQFCVLLSIVSACKRLNLPIPEKPKPIYSYIPLVSPLKKNDKDGFNLGDDNKIKSIEVRNGALCFEVRGRMDVYVYRGKLCEKGHFSI
mmetsp:Transcript_47331/g.71620  ORF Transcript_47331/g.71620 Transcript_47331/m.71620 type:complete len:89 (+) Transcript_47331:1342-1608(+)